MSPANRHEPAPIAVGFVNLTEAIEPPASIEPLWRYAEVQRFLNCSRREVERMRSAGRLPKPDLIVGSRSPRWRPATIIRWAEGGGR